MNQSTTGKIPDDLAIQFFRREKILSPFKLTLPNKKRFLSLGSVKNKQGKIVK